VWNGTVLTIAVPDEAMRDYLELEYRELITGVISTMGLDTIQVVVDKAS
jgi:hypothetical protein